MVVPCFLNILCLRHVSKHSNTNYGKHGGKRDCDNCRQASTCNTKAKSKRSHWWRVTLGNFQDFEAFPNILFLILLEFQNEDLKDIGRRVSRSFAGQFPILFGLCWSVFYFYFCDALFSPCRVCYRDQLKYLIFLTWWKWRELSVL